MYTDIAIDLWYQVLIKHEQIQWLPAYHQHHHIYKLPVVRPEQREDSLCLFLDLI